MASAIDTASGRILAGPLAAEVARFGAPLALGMGLQTAFNLVDAYLIARLEPEVAGPALGALGICDQLAAVGTIISYGLTVATAALLSRRRGQGDQQGVRSIAWQSVLMVGALSVITALVGVFGARQLMVHVVGAKGKVAEIGTSYLRVLMGGGFTIFFLLHLTSIQRALGSSKTPVSMLITSNSANLLLAALLVYGPGPAPPLFSWAPPIARALGIPRLELLGAAWATLIARALVLLPIVIIMVRRFGLFRPPSITPPHIGIFRSIWGIGWPSSVQLVVRILAMLVTHSLVARAYTTAEDQSASTAFGVVFRLETMALFIGLGWGSAAQTFVGQNLGAANPQRAKLSGYYAALFNSVMMAALALVYRLYAERVIGFFDHRPEVLEVGVRYVRLVGWSYVCLGIGIVLGSAIQGAGATKLTLRLDTLVVFAFQLPTSLIAVMGLGMGYERLCQIVALTYFAFAVVYILNYRRGTFLKTQLA